MTVVPVTTGAVATTVVLDVTVPPPTTVVLCEPFVTVAVPEVVTTRGATLVALPECATVPPFAVLTVPERLHV